MGTNKELRWLELVSALTWVTGSFCRRQLPKYATVIIIITAFEFCPTCLLQCITQNSQFSLIIFFPSQHPFKVDSIITHIIGVETESQRG
jgi:hypothetical protein